MDPDIARPELSLMAGAIALGGVCGMVAVLFFFPIIDRFIRPRFKLQRGAAMILLLVSSLAVGTIGGSIGFFWLRDREAGRIESPHPEEAHHVQQPRVAQVIGEPVGVTFNMERD